MVFELTSQQKEILESFSKGNNLRINAFAWTGKTTMLKLIVEHNPNTKFLILVFNKSVQQELKNKFPKNATISTVNAYAYNKMKDFSPTAFKVEDEKQIILRLKKWGISYNRAKALVSIFEKYYNSSIIKINERTIKELISKDLLLFEYFEKSFGKNFEKKEKTSPYKYAASMLSEQIKNMLRWEMPFTHSWYLKCFDILFDSKFKSECNYDAVMLDEWQDTNDVSLSIFEKFNAQKVIVWDTHQWIYWRRGAINAMETLDYKQYYITKSFRINKDTAEKWNTILKNYKQENRSLEAFYDEWGEWNWLSCAIFRTNAWIVKYLFSKFNSWEEFNFRCTRDLDDIFWLALDFENLYNYYKSKNKHYIKNIIDWRIIFLSEICNEWDELWNILKKIDDYDLSANYSLLWTVDKWFSGNWSEELIKELRERLNADYFEWEYKFISFMYDKSKKSYNELSKNIVSTAHSVKWLEFDKVYIADDFPSIFWELNEKFICNTTRTESICKDSNYNRKIRDTINTVEELFYDNKKSSNSVDMRAIIEEVNLMYVAITRAIKELTIESKWIEELLTTPRNQFKQKLIYKITECSTQNLKNCMKLIQTDFENNFTLKWFTYKLHEGYIFNEIYKKYKWNRQPKKIKNKNKKRLIIPYTYFKSASDDNGYRKKAPTWKIDLIIESNWVLYKTQAKIEDERTWLNLVTTKEKYKFIACCFDISSNIIWNWELHIKISSKKTLKDWIIIDLNKLAYIQWENLEVESIKTPKKEDTTESIKALVPETKTIETDKTAQVIKKQPIKPPKNSDESQTNVKENKTDEANKLEIKEKIDNDYNELKEKAESIKKWDISKERPYYYFIDYKAAWKVADALLTSEQKKIIYFKRWYAQYRNEVVEDISKLIKRYFKKRDNIVFICIPASKKAENKERYEWFCKYVSKNTWVKNWFEQVKIIKEKEPKHSWNKHVPAKEWLEFNKEYFKWKYVIIFDDVITDWITMNETRDILISLWAKPIIGLAIWKTIKNHAKDPLI